MRNTGSTYSHNQNGGIWLNVLAIEESSNIDGYYRNEMADEETHAVSQCATLPEKLSSGSLSIFSTALWQQWHRLAK